MVSIPSMRRFFPLLLLIALVDAVVLHLISSPHNDVYALLATHPALFPALTLRHSVLLDSALATAVAGDALFVLADGALAEAAATIITPLQYQKMTMLNFSGVYIEMPTLLPDSTQAYPAPTEAWYRVTVTSSELTTHGLQFLDILQAQGSYFMSYNITQYPAAVLRFAHVAGMDHAIYGLPPGDVNNPVLFWVPLSSTTSMLTASISLSSMVSCRYTPLVRWQALWAYIMEQVTQKNAIFPAWQPLV